MSLAAFRRACSPALAGWCSGAAELGRSAWPPALLGALLLSLAAAAGAAPQIERAIKGERCVEDTATMRRDHMRFLEHQRDDTVRGGVRGAKHSLKACIDCHASAKTGSVAAAKTDFCASCHVYSAVKVDCFECHSSRPARALVEVKK